MTGKDHDIGILNDLIETVIDSADGYKSAATEADASRFSEIFLRRGTERQLLTKKLQSKVRELGGTPEDDGTVLASAHRMFLNLRRAVSSDDKAVIDDVEAGEDHIKGKFEDALADNALSPTTRAEVLDAYEIIKDGHDEIRDLKHAIHGGER